MSKYRLVDGENAVAIGLEYSDFIILLFTYPVSLNSYEQLVVSLNVSGYHRHLQNG